jgi:hypothetical protein
LAQDGRNNGDIPERDRIYHYRIAHYRIVHYRIANRLSDFS